MVINYLELTNFRQFVGTQRINFSTDFEKKVTMIIGTSSAGKTTIIESFEWILYGSSKYNKNKEKIINHDIESRMTTTTKDAVIGEINLCHNDKEYTITRKQNFYKKGADTSVVNIKIKSENGTTRSITNENECKKIIAGIIPNKLFSYFFLQGEDLSNLAKKLSKGDADYLEDAVKSLLNINHFHNAIDHLKLLIKTYDQEISKSTNDKKLQQTFDEIAKKNEELERNKQYRQSKLENINSLKGQLKNKREELNNNENIGNLQKEAEECRKILLKNKEELKNLRKNQFKKFSSEGYLLFINNIASEINEIIKNFEENQKGFFGLRKDIIDYLLETKKCICGAKLTDDSSEFKNLLDLREKLNSTDIASDIKVFKNSLDDKLKNYIREKEYFEENNKKIKELEEEIDQKETRLDDLEKEIGKDSPNVKVLQDEVRKLEAAIDLYNRQVGEYDKNIKDINDSLDELDKDKERLSSMDKTISDKRQYRDTANKVMDILSKYCTEKEKRKRNEIEISCNEIFKTFYDDDIKLVIDEKYNIKIVDKNGGESLSDYTSGGQDVVMALAFICAIINANKGNNRTDDEKEDKEEKYSLVLDAPISNLDNKQIAMFAEKMPEIVDQIIIFINEKDGSILKKSMIDKIDKHYKIVKYDTYVSSIEED